MSDNATRAVSLLDSPDPPSVLQVSRMLNLSPQRIYQILDDHDISPPTKRGSGPETPGEAA